MPQLSLGAQHHVEGARFRGEPDGGLHIDDLPMQVIPVLAQGSERTGQVVCSGQGPRTRDTHGTSGRSGGGLGCPAVGEEEPASPRCWLFRRARGGRSGTCRVEALLIVYLPDIVGLGSGLFGLRRIRRRRVARSCPGSSYDTGQEEDVQELLAAERVAETVQDPSQSVDHAGKASSRRCMTALISCSRLRSAPVTRR